MQNRRIRAFTLIEIMIVIAIIAILAGIMVPNYKRARAEAQLAACKQNMLNIAKAIEVYNIRHSSRAYEPSGKSRTNSSVIHNELIDENHPLVVEGFLKSVPHCPSQYQLYETCKYLKGNNGGCGYTIRHKLPGSRGYNHRDLGYTGVFPIYDLQYGFIYNSDESNKLYQI